MCQKFSNYSKTTQKILPDVIYNIKEVKNIDKVFDLICTNLLIPTKAKQELLEILDVEDRAYKILSIIEKEIEIIIKKINVLICNDMFSSLWRSQWERNLGQKTSK